MFRTKKTSQVESASQPNTKTNESREKWRVVSEEIIDSKERPFSALPDNVRELIMSFLSYRDLVKAGAVDKKSQAISHALALKKLPAYIEEHPEHLVETIPVEKKSSWLTKQLGGAKKENVPLISYYIHENQEDMFRAFVDSYVNSQKAKEKYPDYLETLLVEAVKQNKTTMVHYLLKIGVNPNFITKDGFSPLGIAVKNDDLAMCKRLLQYGAKAYDADLEDVKQPLALVAGRLSANLKQLAIAKCLVNDPATFDLIDANTIKWLENTYQKPLHKQVFSKVLDVQIDASMRKIFENAVKLKNKQTNYLASFREFLTELIQLQKHDPQNAQLKTRINLLNSLCEKIEKNKMMSPGKIFQQWKEENPHWEENFAVAIISPPVKTTQESSFFRSSVPPSDFSDQKLLSLLKAYAGTKRDKVFNQPSQERSVRKNK